MTQDVAPARGGLAGLGGRLAGGVCLAARRSRPGDWRLYDERALTRQWPGGIVGLLPAIRSADWGRSFADHDPVGRLATHLGANRNMLVTVVLSPSEVLDHLLGAVNERAGAAGSWAGLCWIAEAAWRVVTGEPSGSGYVAGDRELLVPLAARLRFLALSEPMRWRGQAGSWWSSPADLKAAGSKNGLVDRAFGEHSWNLVVGRCREARRHWRACLDAYQSHPLLALAAPAEIEAELAGLVFQRGSGGEPLVVSVSLLSESAEMTAEDASVAAEIAERHLLPRFDLPAIAALARYAPRRRGRVARIVWAVAATLAGAGAAVSASLLAVHAATGLAVLCYGLIASGVVVFGSRWAALWLLRLPAASTVGLFALVSLLPGSSWLHTPQAGWAACAALAGAAYGYLVIEARNHGVAAGAALRRSAGVALIGSVHALLVSLIGLVVVAPAFVAEGTGLAALWRHPGYGHAGMVFLLATTWCLAVGVFSQILWDDRPITAPLAHLQWRSGR
jgi:hypothetical protein